MAAVPAILESSTAPAVASADQGPHRPALVRSPLRPPSEPPPTAVCTPSTPVATTRLNRPQRRNRGRRSRVFGPALPVDEQPGPHLVVVNVAGLDRMGDAVAQSLLSSQPPSVIAVLVNETKIFELDPSIDIPGWSWLRGWEFDPACTQAQRTMRGQGVFVRNNWSRDLSVLSKHPSHLWLELRRRKRQPLVICSVYLPPIGAFSSCSLGTEHPRRFTRPEFLRTLSLIFAEARGFARGPPPVSSLSAATSMLSYTLAKHTDRRTTTYGVRFPPYLRLKASRQCARWAGSETLSSPPELALLPLAPSIMY